MNRELTDKDRGSPISRVRGKKGNTSLLCSSKSKGMSLNFSRHLTECPHCTSPKDGKHWVNLDSSDKIQSSI